MKTTQIGSLPFTDITEALDFSFKHSLPFVPDLPNINPDEFMLEQAKLSMERSYEQIALNKFLDRLENLAFQGEIKNQLPGPLCLCRFLNWNFQKAYDVWSRMLENRIEKFDKIKNNFWIFIDEPSFFQESEGNREKIFKALESFSDFKLAIHYCGSDQIHLDSWPKNLALSFDTHLHEIDDNEPDIGEQVNRRTDAGILAVRSALFVGLLISFLPRWVF